MITKAHARKLRKAIEKTAVTLTDSEAFDVAELFPMWKVDTAYQTGDRVQYDSKLYKCIQSHTSQADWIPSTAVSLWVEVADPAIEYPEWVQPTGAHDAYMTGDKVSHNEKHWISEVDNNVWEPGTVGTEALWREVN
jgi:chitodextrinase